MKAGNEAHTIETLQHFGTLVVKAAATVDSHGLDGFKQALARMTKDCSRPP